MSEEANTNTVSESVAPPPSPVVKEAEVKLKEMSRKAKERKTASAPRRVSAKQDGTNLRMVLIGGFGVGVLGILYLMLRQGPKEKFIFTPIKVEEPPKLSPKKETPPAPKRSVGSSTLSETGFEMNSF